MYKLCKTEQSASRQRELEKGLLNAMATSHYDEISISDLCAQMNIPRKSFYRYFSGKDGALHALIDHTLMQYEHESVHVPIRKRMSARQELENLFQFWQEQKPLLDVLAKSGLSGVLIQRMIDHSLAAAGYQRTTERSVLPGEEENAIMFAICGLMTMVISWHHSGYGVPAHRMAELAAGILTKPLFPEL